MYRVLSLFAGIGGFDLGLERTGGFRTVAFCEIDPFCRKVLAKHWPSVPCYDDVRTLTAERLQADEIAVDCIVGGFPCQDISYAGLGAGLAGERSGLWSEFARLIGELRPRLVIVENVSALLTRGLDAVLGTMASFRLDVEWHCIPATYVGAPHRRDRVWIVGYADSQGKPALAVNGEASRMHGLVANTAPLGRGSRRARGFDPGRPRQSEQPLQNVADATRILARRKEQRAVRERVGASCQPVPFGRWWLTEPDVGRVAHGVPARVDRLRSLGNAVVPQIPEMIGRAILDNDERLAA